MSKQMCRLCGSSHVRPAFQAGPYTIMKCRRCTFGWPEPFPTDKELGQFYRDCRHPAAICDAVNREEREKTVRILRRLRHPPANLLDVGCGFGHDLDVARRYGFQTFGVEVDPGRAAEAIKKGHNVQIGALSPSTFQGVHFDVVILSHIIEHLRNPEEIVKQIRERMVQDGLLFIATPNFAGVISAITGLHYTPPEHIAYFTRASLVRLLENCGFYLTREKPFTHYIRTKHMIAHILKFGFLRKAAWQDPRTEHTPKRFVEGRFRIIRIIIYNLVLVGSRLITPMIYVLGEDHLHMYWRKR